MPLPPALLERLKRRKIIQEAATSKQVPETPAKKVDGSSTKLDDLHARYGEQSRQSAVVQQDEQEEIIAADYSDEEKSNASPDRWDRDENSDSNDGSDVDQQIDDKAHEPSGSEEYELEPGESDQPDNVFQDQEMIDSVIGCPNKYNIYHECSKFCLDTYGSLESTGPSLEQRKHLALVLRSFPLSPGWSVVYDPGVKTFYFWNRVTDHVSWFPPAMNSFSTPSADHIRRTMRQLDDQMHD